MNDDPVYVKINRKIWNTNQLRGLSRDARELYLYLITCPHGNMLGMFILRPGYVLDDLQLGSDRERFFRPLSEIIQSGLFKYDEKNEILLDREQILKHPPMNPMGVSSCVKIINSLPKTELYHELKQSIQQLKKPYLKPLLERLNQRLGFTEAVTEAVTETVTETEYDSPDSLENDSIINLKSIIDYLNEKTGKKFSIKTKATLSHIRARINEGYSLDDFKKVIDTKYLKWNSDPKMRDYLRPETLFGTKFDGYLNENAHQLTGIVSDKTIKTVEMLNKWSPPL